MRFKLRNGFRDTLTFLSCVKVLGRQDEAVSLGGPLAGASARRNSSRSPTATWLRQDFVGGLVVIAVALFAFWQAALRMMAYEDAGGSMCEARSAL